MKKISNQSSNLTVKDVIFYSSILKNPILIQAIGLCPVVAIATSLKTAVILAAITLIVLVVTEVIASLMLKKISRWLRVVIYVFLGVAIVTPIMFVMDRYADTYMTSFGIYLPLLAVNSIVVLQCEQVAMKTTVGNAFIDAIASSTGYGSVIIIVGALREVLGSGTIWGKTLSEASGAKGLLMPFGGFLIIGFLAAALKWIFSKGYPDYAQQLETNSRLTIDKKKLVMRRRTSGRTRSAKSVAVQNQSEDNFYVANMQTTVKTVTVTTETLSDNGEKIETEVEEIPDKPKPRRGRPPKNAAKKDSTDKPHKKTSKGGDDK